MNGKAHILLVEDNEDHVFLTKKAIEKFENDIGIVIHVVTDGAMAIDFVKKNSPHENAPTPDLILLDIKLPNKNGFEVLEIFKKDKRFKSIPIIMLTSSDDENDIAQSYNLGSNSYITKPINTDELIGKLRSIPNYWFHTNSLPRKTAFQE